MHRPITTLATVAMLATLQAACVTAPTVSETRAAVTLKGATMEIQFVIAISAIAIILLGVSIMTAYRHGRSVERRLAAERRLQAVNERREVEDEIAQLGPADVDERLSRWMRDKR